MLESSSSCWLRFLSIDYSISSFCWRFWVASRNLSLGPLPKESSPSWVRRSNCPHSTPMHLLSTPKTVLCFCLSLFKIAYCFAIYWFNYWASRCWLTCWLKLHIKAVTFRLRWLWGCLIRFLLVLLEKSDVGLLWYLLMLIWSYSKGVQSCCWSYFGNNIAPCWWVLWGNNQIMACIVGCGKV